MEKDLILNKEDVHNLNVILTRLIDNARVDCALLINKSGRLLTSQSETSEFDKTSLAALVTGSFASSCSIANMIGEEEFSGMVQEGSKRHIYVALIDEHTIITCIYDKRTNLAKVKSTIANHIQPLRNVLSTFYCDIVNDPYINLDVT